jgi:UDP-N-acetylmuramoyl-tripeptide--D-alanyl-D-alanine ligase
MTATIDNIYSLFLKHPVISTDSRRLIPGCLFFALKGENFDGNEFVDYALKNGALYAIADNQSLPDDARIIKVESVLKCLHYLALLHRKSLDIPVLAITGSNGKTTTKELCAAVLSKKFNLVYTQGNLNNHIGVPLTLLRLTDKTDFAIVEMGANHIGEIRKLCQIALPNYGIITNIGKAHIEGFGSLTGVINAKSELYTHIDDNNGKLFVNIDNSLLETLSKNISRFTYGSAVSADVYGELVVLNPYIHLIWEYKGMQSSLQTSMIGDYNLENILAAITTGCYFGISKHDIESAIRSYVPSNNRSQLMKTKRNSLVLDAYNANPVSMQMAINSCKYIHKTKPLYILGDMLELGGESQTEHASILKLLTDIDARDVFLIGAEFGKVYAGDDWEWFPGVEALAERLRKKPVKGFDILLKGSRGIGLERIIDLL